VAALIALLLMAATLSFGAVYSWGYLPLFTAAGGIGIFGLCRWRGVPADARIIAAGLLLVAIAIASQLAPVSRGILEVLSPRTIDLLSRYSLAFTDHTRYHSLSLDPSATALALAGLIAFGLYLTGLTGLWSRRDLHTLPRYLVLFAVPLALFGIFNREHSNGLVYGFWQPQAGPHMNVFGPFVNRNHFAGWMLMATCLAIGGLCGQAEVALRGLKPGLRRRVAWLLSAEANRLLLLAISIVVMTTALVWTMSRSGIVGLFCAVGCFAWLMACRRNVSPVIRTAGITVVGGALIAGLSWRGVDLLTLWFADTRDLLSRFAAWHDGWQVVRDFPLAGTGLNTYTEAMIFYQKSNLDVHMAQAHNDYLQLLAEGGVLVAVPAAVTILLLAVAIRRSLQAARVDSYEYWVRAGATVALVAIGIQETVEFSLQMPANAFLFATLASIAICPRVGAKIPAPGSQGAKNELIGHG
jgi:O-antigen ligase